MTEQRAVGWDDPYGTPAPCPECGSADAEFLPHEPGCPSGYPTREADARDRLAATTPDRPQQGHPR